MGYESYNQRACIVCLIQDCLLIKWFSNYESFSELYSDKKNGTRDY